MGMFDGDSGLSGSGIQKWGQIGAKDYGKIRAIKAIMGDTQNRDWSDINEVKRTFGAISAIDPAEGVAFLKTALPIVKAESARKLSDYKFKQAEKEPLIKQRWQLQGKDNAAKIFAIGKLQGIPIKEDTLNEFTAGLTAQNIGVKLPLFLNKLVSEGLLSEEDRKVYKMTDYKQFMKDSYASYLTNWMDKDITETPETPPGAAAKPKVKVVPPPSVKYQPTEGAGYEDVEGLPTVDPEKPQYVQALQEGKAKSNIQGRLNSIWYGFHSFKPEFMMSDADLALEDRQDAVQDWISSNDAYVFFKENPKELPKFEANPIEYYETNIKK